MFVHNKAKKNIELRSFEGYKFSIPPGVSWIWDKAGKHLLDNVYKVETSRTISAKDKALGLDQGFGVPALLSSTEKAWLDGGKQLVRVERYKINGKQVPRKALITTAQQRGVPNARILEYIADSQIDALMIAEDINTLPVPESIVRPVDFETLESTPQMATV